MVYGMSGEVYAGPVVPISFGELADKITILQIKTERLSQAAQLANVHRELKLLAQEWDRFSIEARRIANLVADLRQINEQLWDIEDAIRRCEAESVFDKGFIELARQVYLCNDRRAAVKRLINKELRSTLFEEKSFSKI